MYKKINLRKLILLICFFSVIVSLASAFYSIYHTQRALIIDNTMESNRVYAEKMAEMTNAFIGSSMSQLRYSAKILSTKFHDQSTLRNEVDRLKYQTNSFNSVVIVNSEGVIASISPETIQVQGVKLKSYQAKQSLRAKKPLVTDPFISPAGNFLTSISYPIFSESGEYLGYISGTIYLDKENILSTLLSKHSYVDGSYLYVVDRNHTILYHPNQEMVGKTIDDNAAINSVTEGKTGGKDIFNSQGVEMLAGYSAVTSSGWGIVAQKSKSLTLKVLQDRLKQVVLTTLPLAIIILIFIWFASAYISRPLWQLANIAKNFENHLTVVDELRKITPWYYEVSNLKRSFMTAFNVVSSTIDELNTNSMTDSLTGLLNRRGFETVLEGLETEKKPFSVLAIDIDYFKKVNDTYGHDAGDKLLICFAETLKKQAREKDFIIRAGGEEFFILLPSSDGDKAEIIAERIRKSIESTNYPLVGNITASIGISHYSNYDEPIDETLKLADQALYKAKSNGRNRIETNY